MKGLIPKIKLFFKHNGGTILTCVSAVGVIITAVAAVKATPKASMVLKKAEQEKGEKLTKIETVRIAGPSYIPSIMIGTATIACIFGANALNKRQQAAVLSLYTLLDSSYKEYKNKVNDIFGEDANKQVIQAIAEDHYNEVPKSTDGKCIFMDFNSLQIFESTLDDIKDAEIVINTLLIERGYIYLNEYYEILGIPSTCYDEEAGWSLPYIMQQGYEGIELICDKSKNNPNCYLITTNVDPVSDYMIY